MSTFLNLGITPVLYVIIKSLELRGGAAGRDGHTRGEVAAEASPDSASDRQGRYLRKGFEFVKRNSPFH